VVGAVDSLPDVIGYPCTPEKYFQEIFQKSTEKVLTSSRQCVSMLVSYEMS